jgi:chromosome condensin MukBEF complex kleisin-like MukF subunit
MQGNIQRYAEKPFMPPQTNADRIRAMTDEELADSLYEAYADGFYTAANMKLYDKITPVKSPECFLEYLRQPAKEAT